jgi:hypothetical protein
MSATTFTQNQILPEACYLSKVDIHKRPNIKIAIKIKKNVTYQNLNLIEHELVLQHKIISH